MRFLVDECTGPIVARWLVDHGHEVFSVYDEGRGMNDDDILVMAHTEQRILITNDKDFGEKVFRDKHQHHGVIFLRLQDERAPSKIDAIDKLLQGHASYLLNAFVVVTETHVRFAQT